MHPVGNERLQAFKTEQDTAVVKELDLKYMSMHSNEYFSSALAQTLTSNDDPEAFAAYQQRNVQKLKAQTSMMIKHA